MAQRVLVVDDSATLRRLLCAVLRGGGYEVESAADGAEGLERAQEGVFDLMLVDFVMPRLNGYQLTQAIRSIPAMRSLPVVLVSARTEQIGQRFMAQTGAVAALEKPFTPATLLNVVARALGDRHSLPPGALDDATTEDLLETGPGYRNPSRSSVIPEGDDDSPRTSRITLAPPFVTRAATVDIDALTESLARVIAPAMSVHVTSGRTLDAATLAQTLRREVPTGAWAEVTRALRSGDSTTEGDPGLSGRLGLVPLGEVFQLLNLQAQTGLLVVRQGDTVRSRQVGPEVTVAFRGGKIDQAVGRRLGDAWRLGRYFVTSGDLSRTDLDAMAQEMVGRAGLFGLLLQAKGHIDQEQLDRALHTQTCELVYEMLRWTTGSYRFDVGATLPAAQIAQMALPGDTLVLEGFRRIDEWRLMEPLLASEKAVFARNEALVSVMATDRLERDEQRILEAIDGRRSVRELVEALDLAAFDVCKIMHRLSRARLVAMDPA